MGAHPKRRGRVVDLDADGAAGKTCAPEIEGGVERTGQGFGAETEAGISRADAERLGKTAVVSWPRLAGPYARMKRLDRRCRHGTPLLALSVAVGDHLAKGIL
jgi:hypothetical protein